MVALTSTTLILGDKVMSIRAWEVWFQTPFGLVDNLVGARKLVQNRDLDPELTIVPVCVALGDGDYYEVVVRG